MVECAAARGAGSVRAVARLLTRIESGGSGAAAVAAVLAGRPRRARVLGLTGAPGVGKSTLTAALVRRERDRGSRVAVLAVDPSSPFTGGALLGDRVRMGELATDPGVYIRSLSSRGQLGGLSAATPGAVDLLSALGFDLVLVETVGVGQNEVDVLRLADTVLVVTAPGMGDGVQAAKAGILEIADVLVVNKADREGASTAVRELKSVIALGRAGTAQAGTWRIPVISTIAAEGVNGAGLEDLGQQTDAHDAFLATTGLIRQRRLSRAGIAVETIVAERLSAVLRSSGGRAELLAQATAVVDDGIDPYAAADALWSWIADPREP